MDCKGVHILFCDHDPDSGSKTLELLHKCSYKVTTVKTARQVLDAVESENCDVDIVLSDMELPKDTGFRMLKRIMRKDELNHIAVVVMSERDEMPIVAKCLQLGAVDYLVKPLRLNEVLNLWTHMWRKRKMLGFPEKHAIVDIVKQPAEYLESVTTSEVIVGKDKENVLLKSSIMNEKSKAEVPPRLELSLKLSSSYNSEKRSDEDSVIRPPTKDNFHRASAFSLYTRPNKKQSTEHSANICSVGSPLRSGSSLNGEMHVDFRDTLGVKSTNPTCDSYCESAKDSSPADENKPCDMESRMSNGSPNGVIPSPPSEMTFSGEQNIPSDGSNVEKDAFVTPTIATTSQQTPHPPTAYYCESSNNINVPEANCNVYAYYPVGQMVMPQFVGYSGWPTMVIGSPVVGGKLMQTERREAALHKFRMKRKGRCFEKRIRYVSRKKLAEQRPRVRGQFVKRTAVTNMEENMVIQTEYPDEGGEADDEQGCSELDNHSSPECMDEG